MLRTVLLAVSLAPLACRPPGPGKAAAAEGEDEGKGAEATPVLVGTIHAGEITATISAASTIEAERQVTVHAESIGRIVSLSVEEGDEVKGGKLLAQIKADAQASGLDRASTSLEKAKIDLETVERLYSQKVASREELDSARLTYENAQHDVRDRRRDVRNTRVTAPFSGTVTERFVTEGAFVTSGAQLVTITDFDTLVARVFVPEKELDRIREDQPAEIVGKAARGRHGTGVVRRIAPVVDATTGTVKVTVGLPATLVGGDHGFLPGMYAEVTLTTETRQRAVLVPKQALVSEDDAAFVFVVEGDVAKRRAVELGLEDAENAEVLSGLAPGDEVVLAGQAGLKDGAKVQRVDASGDPVEASAPGGDGIADRAAGKTAGGA